jgi:hypothetical protein
MRGKRVSDDVHILHARHPSSQRQLRRRAIGKEVYASARRSGQGEMMSKSVARVAGSARDPSHLRSHFKIQRTDKKRSGVRDLAPIAGSLPTVFIKIPI